MDHRGLERLQPKGLRDHRHSPSVGPSHHRRVIVGGDDDDGHGRGAVPDGLDDVPAALVEASESTPAIGRGLAGIPERLNEVADDRPNARVVVDHEHPRWMRSCHGDWSRVCKSCQCRDGLPEALPAPFPRLGGARAWQESSPAERRPGTLGRFRSAGSGSTHAGVYEPRLAPGARPR